MFKFKKIPKKVFLYAGFSNLSFLRFMTICSLSKLNTDWKIFVYKPITLTKNITWNSGENKGAHSNYRGPCCFDRLKDLDNVEVIKFDFSEIKISNSLPEVHKSDFLRWHLLSTIGGMWSDIDILYHKPLSNMNDLTENSDIECFYCFLDSAYHTIGFNFSAPGNKFYSLAWNLSKSRYVQESYQSIGSSLLNQLHNTIDTKKSFDIPRSLVYPFVWDQASKIFNDPSVMLPDNNIGIHWFGGGCWDYEQLVNESNFNKFDNIISRKIEEVFI